MSDKKNDGEFEWDSNWDNALDEWEKKAFSDENFDEPALRTSAPPPDKNANAPEAAALEATAATVEVATAAVPPRRVAQPPSTAKMPVAKPISVPRVAAPRAEKAPDSVTRTEVAAPRPSAPGYEMDALEATRTHFDPALIESARMGRLPAAVPADPKAERPSSQVDESELSKTLTRDGARTLDPETNEIDSLLDKPAEEPIPAEPSSRTLGRMFPTSPPSLVGAAAAAALREPPSNESLDQDDDLASPPEAPTARSERQLAPLPDDDDAESGDVTVARPSVVPDEEPRSPSTARGIGNEPEAPRRSSLPPPLPMPAAMHNDLEASADDVVFEDERPAPQWLSDEARTQFEARAAWLEAEAAHQAEGPRAARLLMAASELHAILGDRLRARELAEAAAERAPELEAAVRLARSHAVADEGLDALERLAAEAQVAATEAGRLHAMLLAADVARHRGEDPLPFLNLASKVARDPRTTVLLLALRQDRDVRARISEVATAEGDPLSLADTTLSMLFGDSPLGEVPHAALSLRRAREALRDQRAPEAVAAISELGALTEISAGAAWLAALLSMHHDGARASAADYLAKVGREAHALRALAAFGVETRTPSFVEMAMSDADALSDREKLIVTALGGGDPGDLAVLDGDAQADALGAALGSLASTGRERRTASPLQRLARVVGGGLEAQIEDALADIPSDQRSTGAGALELHRALANGDHARTIELLSALLPDDDADAAMATAFASEGTGAPEGARELYRKASLSETWGETALFAGDAGSTRPQRLLRAATETDGIAGGILAIEALVGGDAADLPADGRAELLHRAQSDAGRLGLAAFIGERLAVQNDDPKDAARWVDEQRSVTDDALEQAIAHVREALFFATDEDGARSHLEEAHRLRPADIGLRDMLEGAVAEPREDGAAWREERAPAHDETVRAILLLEAAYEHARSGNHAAILRTAQEASNVGVALGRVMAEDAELATGESAALAERLLLVAKESEDAQRRLEAYERLAELDARRHDPSSALLWHRTVLDEFPGHLPSLRVVEHALIGEGREEELEPVATALARALSDRDGPETIAHATLAARLRVRSDDAYWPQTRELAELAAAQGVPSLWAVRAANAHARFAGDDGAILKTAAELADRNANPMERAALLLRCADAASRLGRTDDAREALEKATKEDPGDVVAWGLLVEARANAGDVRAAAEACENVARTSNVDGHRIVAWYDAANMWQRDLEDEDRALLALEQAAGIDPSYEDVFARLSQLYTAAGRRGDLAQLLEQRLDRAADDAERVSLQVDLGRALAEMGDHAAAARALESALETNPDHPAALAAFADIKHEMGDYQAAESSWVRLARLLSSEDEQRIVYEKLGDVYATHLGNPTRAEAALREVLKRAPDDEPTLKKLVDVYRAQGDMVRAIETFEGYLKLTHDPHERERRLVELGALYEGHNQRKAELVLESARKEYPTSVFVLRAMAEFYARQKQTPAMNILLDRAAADARRAIAAGRFTASLFETLSVVAELRGRAGGARVVAASLQAFEGQPSKLDGMGARAVDPRIDELSAPELLSPAFRALLARTGDALDVAAPLDLRPLGATAVPPEYGKVAQSIAELSQQMGMGGLQIAMSPRLGRVCLPCTSNPPTLLIGEPLLRATSELARTFLVVRSLKLIYMRASALVRTPSQELSVLIGAWVKAFNPNWVAPGLNANLVAEAGRRLAPGLPRQADPQLGVIALEAAAGLSNLSAGIGGAALLWANRTALLAVGDPGAALEAIAWSLGQDALPQDSEARHSWIARTPDARDLLTFSVSDPYLEARRRGGLTS